MIQAHTSGFFKSGFKSKQTNGWWNFPPAVCLPLLLKFIIR